MGHNLALDLFGPPSADEAAAGLGVHGESSVVDYEVCVEGDRLLARAMLPLAHLTLERSVRLVGNGVAEIEETVTNLLAFDRPIAWTQHVTLGPPFIESGRTRLHLPAHTSRTHPEDFGPLQRLRADATFDWPLAPAKNGGVVQMATYPDVPSGYITGHLVRPNSPYGYFHAWHSGSQTLIGYCWTRSDFPWICLWEENRSRAMAPWNGTASTWGIEFGASPFAESRQNMIDRGQLFDTPAYRWLGALRKASVRYFAYTARADGSSVTAEPPAYVLDRL